MKWRDNPSELLPPLSETVTQRDDCHDVTRKMIACSWFYRSTTFDKAGVWGLYLPGMELVPSGH
jgi:hypothetical protein